MTASENPVPLSRDALLALVAELRRQLIEVTAHNEALRAELEQLKRRDKRQAAPFSKGTRVAQPKRPGRKPGTGSFCYRTPPAVGPDDRTARGGASTARGLPRLWGAPAGRTRRLGFYY